MTHRLPPHRGGYRPLPPSTDLTERPAPPGGRGGGSPMDLIGATVALRYVDGRTRGVGRVISQTDEPTVAVEYADGTRESWLTRLAEPFPLADVPACPYCRERGRHTAECRHAGNDCLPVIVAEPLLWDGDQA